MLRGLSDPSCIWAMFLNHPWVSTEHLLCTGSFGPRYVTPSGQARREESVGADSSLWPPAPSSPPTAPGAASPQGVDCRVPECHTLSHGLLLLSVRRSPAVAWAAVPLGCSWFSDGPLQRVAVWARLPPLTPRLPGASLLVGHRTLHCTPGAGDGQGSLACCSPWGCKEWDTTE